MYFRDEPRHRTPTVSRNLFGAPSSVELEGDSDDRRGQVKVTVGIGASTAPFVDVTFGQAFPVPPFVVVGTMSSNESGVPEWVCQPPTTTGFRVVLTRWKTIGGAQAPGNGSIYRFSYNAVA